MSKPEEKQLSPEEVAAYLKTRNEYCDERLPLLRKEAELAELQFKVDNFYLNRRLTVMKLAELDAPNEPKEPAK